MCKLYKVFLIILVFLMLESELVFAISISPDGSLADWKGIKPIELFKEQYVVYNKLLWHGPEDVSAKVYLFNTKRYLYIGLEVIDNSLVLTKGLDIAPILKSDHIEIWVDTNPTRKLKYKMDQYVHQFIFTLNEQESCIELYPKKIFDIKSIRYATKRTKKGYIFEARIPGYILNAPSIKLNNIGFLIDIVDIDKGGKTQQGTFLSISPKRKWGNPATFYKWHFSFNPLFTYKAFNKISPLSLYYAKEKFMDINNDNIEDIVFFVNYRDSSHIEVSYISPNSLEIGKNFKYKLPITNVVPRLIIYNKHIKFFAIEGEISLGYPVLELFKWEDDKKILKNVGIIISKGIEVYPTVRDIDNDGNSEIVLSYRDGVRVYKYKNGRFVQTR